MTASAKPEPFPIEFVDECDSTNRVLIDRVRSGGVSPVLLVARRQTAGKGRLGRTWDAPAGSAFTGSWLVPMRENGWVEHPWLLSIGVALAVGDVLVELGLEHCFHLKWPNDIMTTSNTKLCGILAEFVSAPTSGATAVVVGAGLNLIRPQHVDGVLAERGAWVNELLSDDQPDDRLLLESVAIRLNDHVRFWLIGNGPEQAISEYRKRCSTIGQHVRVEQIEVTWDGIATDVSSDGSLMVTDSTGLARKVTAADVVHVRPAPNRNDIKNDIKNDLTNDMKEQP